MKLTLFDPDNVAQYHGDVVAAALARLAWMRAESAALHTSHPDRDGVLHWMLIVNPDPEGIYVRGQSLTLGVLRRSCNDNVEFHS